MHTNIHVMLDPETTIMPIAGSGHYPITVSICSDGRKPTSIGLELCIPTIEQARALIKAVEKGMADYARRQKRG